MPRLATNIGWVVALVLIAGFLAYAAMCVGPAFVVKGLAGMLMTDVTYGLLDPRIKVQ